ncbi:MAG: phosphoribosylglycinamide formyltransferase, partial [Longimicrobiales bacterium]|nr:phosphoribosylglycinamide formyltransferase [Longimicrobiales bacterium]
LDHQSDERPCRIDLLVTDRPGVGAVDRAERAGVASQVIPVAGRSPEAVGLETLELLEKNEIQVVLLAGYLRLIPQLVVEAFPKRILNIHPALLPAFGGKGMWGHHVHEAVLASGAAFSGPTIHFVDARYDTGAILAQWPVPVLADDSAETLAARVLRVEHVLYPLAADHLCRAVEAGRPPRRLSLSGEAFMIADTFSPDAVAGQIAAAFLAARG